MMLPTHLLTAILVASLSLTFIGCPPVSERPQAAEFEKNENETKTEETELGLEYERYMREVVTLLESDSEFRKKLEQVNSSQIRSGEIADHLDLVSHTIRTKLDEIKRQEVERLRTLIRIKGRLKQKETENNTFSAMQMSEIESLLGHLDFKNPHSFEVSDLTKLIKKTTTDLEELDARRKKEFKRYEMEKELTRREELSKMSEEERLKAEKEHEEMEQKHRDHPKINHPGNEEQLKEVWEEDDGLDREDFDPKTFFHIHDTDGDGLLDLNELEALFQTELDKMYNENATEDDMMERFEEMNRMREHVMNEVDVDKDGMISMEEFIRSTNSDEFKKNEPWQALDNQTIYTDDELEQFQKEFEERLAHDERPQLTTLPSNHPVDQINNKQPQDDQQQQHSFQEKQPHQEGKFRYERRPPTVIPMSEARKESPHNPREPPPYLF